MKMKGSVIVMAVVVTAMMVVMMPPIVVPRSISVLAIFFPLFIMVIHNRPTNYGTRNRRAAVFAMMRISIADIDRCHNRHCNCQHYQRLQQITG